MNIYNTKLNIQFDYSSMPNMSEFYDFRYDFLKWMTPEQMELAENKDNVKSLKSKFIQHIVGDREIIDFPTSFNYEDLEILEIAKCIKFKSFLGATSAMFPDLTKPGKAVIVVKSQRSSVNVIENVLVSDGFSVKLTDDLSMYGNEKLSVGLRFESGLMLSIICRPSSSGRKTGGDVLFSYATKDRYVTVDLIKINESANLVGDKII